jgi:hypothetical protein
MIDRDLPFTIESIVSLRFLFPIVTALPANPGFPVYIGYQYLAAILSKIYDKIAKLALVVKTFEAVKLVKMGG